MNFVTKKNFLFKLIISICIILAITNCSGGQKVYAAEEAKQGGTLLSPICDLLLGIGDALMNILQNAIMGTDATLELENTRKIDWGKVLLWLVVIAVAVAATIITAGGIWAAIGPMLLSAVKIAAVVAAVCLAVPGGTAVVSAVLADSLTDVVVLPTYNIGPEEIFSGRILLFDANIFNPKEVRVEYNIIDEADGTTVTGSGTTSLENWNETYKFDSKNQPKRFYYEKNGKEIDTSINNSAYELRNVITKWYYRIRTIALVGSMIILLYIGIKIIISSVAEEKAKYKQMLGDWVIAFCLIFLLHYIMIFSHNIVESITNIFTNVVDNGAHVVSIADLTNDNNTLIEAIKDIETEEGQYYDEAGKLIKWPTNLMGRIRMEAQKQDGTIGYIGFAVAYIVLVIYTLTFAFTYIKRLLYLLFLTVIAPFVALTYPVDKLHDGKAQAFDMWLKEYIFNLIIQPFHLLLYTIFVSMAFELSSTNIIYTLVVLGFMMPAEKFLRSMFGFNKASTPGMLGGAAGAALTMSAVNSLGKFAKGGHGGPGGKDGGKNGKDEQGKLRMPNSGSEYSRQTLFEGLSGSNSDEKDGEQDNGSNEENHDNGPSEEEIRKRALDRYMNEGGRQNDEGHYFNPSMDEFDENYDPSTDDIYRNGSNNNSDSSDSADSIDNTDSADSIDNTDSVDSIDSADNDNSSDDSNSADNGNSSDNGETKKPSKAKRFLRATGRMAGRTLKEAGISALKAAPGTALRMAANVTAGATLGALGLAAGIASGDPSKAFQNTTAAAGVGVAVTNGIANRAASSIKRNANPNAAQQWEKDFYGAEYKQHLAEKQDKEFMKDKDIQEMYRVQLGLKNKEEVKKAMEEAKEYRAFGVNDNSIIIKAMKSKKVRSSNRADRQRIAAAVLAEQSKTQKDFKTNMDKFRKVPGMSEKQANKMEEMVMEINNLF